jgi:4-amino-4-deoxy-L-arabinose transferase-like glycosyltransferase
MRTKPSTVPRRPEPSCPPTAAVSEPISPILFAILAAVLALGVFAVYSPSLNFQFILDDHRFLNDPRITTPGHFWEYLTSYVWAQTVGGQPSFYRPIFVLWLRLNFILSGTSTWGWHFLSIAKHAAVSALLGLLVWRLLKDRIAALIAATLFALHPAHTESVAWVTVPDPLMAASVLGCLLLYLHYSEFPRAAVALETTKSRRLRKATRTNESQRSAGLWLAASAIAGMAGLMAKETAIVVPAIIFILGFIFIPQESHEARKRSYQVHLLQVFRITVPFVLAALVYILLRASALGWRVSTQTQHLPWTTVVLSWPATLWFYIQAMVWPVHSYAFADSIPTDHFSAGGVLLPSLAIVCAASLVMALVCWAWSRTTAFAPKQSRIAVVIGLLLLALPVLPALNLNALNPGDYLHGRYTYLSAAGLMLLLATAWHLAGKWRMPLLLVAFSLMIAFIVLTLRQEMAWKDDATVFTVAHQIAPLNEPVALNLTRTRVQAAFDLDQAGRCEEALPVFQQATQQYPQDWFAWAGLGDCYVQLNELSKADQSLRRAAELSRNPRVKEQWQAVHDKLQQNAGSAR